MTTIDDEIVRVKVWLEDRMRVAVRTGQMVSEEFTFSPAQAQYVLDHHNKRNRPLRPSRVENYAKTIREGRHQITSQGISFGVDGNQNNGQHRLSAVVMSGQPVTFYVTFGESTQAFQVLDAPHGVRTSADVLAIERIPHYAQVAAAARLCIYHDPVAKTYFNRQVTSDVILKFVRENPLLVKAGQVGSPVCNKLKVSSAGVIYAFFVILRDSRKEEKALDRFCEALLDPTTTEQKTVLRLRDGLMKKTFEHGINNSASRALANASAIIKAWNNVWLRKKSPLGPIAGQPFPEPV